MINTRSNCVMFLNQSHFHQGCISVIKNIVKTWSYPTIIIVESSHAVWHFGGNHYWLIDWSLLFDELKVQKNSIYFKKIFWSIINIFTVMFN